jgi:hypothetical protein
MAVPDRVVQKALAAYEELPPESGRFERMRAAIEAIMRKNDHEGEEP